MAFNYFSACQNLHGHEGEKKANVCRENTQQTHILFCSSLKGRVVKFSDSSQRQFQQVTSEISR